jgi:hypothetical protein
MLEKELVAASTEPLILSSLSQGESYGYELIQEVKRLSSGKIGWTDGMLYPVFASHGGQRVDQVALGPNGEWEAAQVLLDSTARPVGVEKQARAMAGSGRRVAEFLERRGFVCLTLKNPSHNGAGN